MAHKFKSKGFFALDINQFERVQQKGFGVEEAATYLSLLKSTNQGNVVSSGGINSVMGYSGLTRAEVKRAIRNLESKGLIECLEVERKRARTVDRYKLPIHDHRQALSIPKERGTVDAIVAGQQPNGQSEIQAAHRAASKGWIEKRSDGWQVIEHSNTVAFIPNSFVQVSKGHSPLHRLVNGGELNPIMLAARLYQLQDLMDERGVPLGVVRGHFYPVWHKGIGNHRLHLLGQGRHKPDRETGYTGFNKSHHWAWRGKETFWDDLHALDAMHVTEWSVYSANGQHNREFDFNRPQRPLGVLRNGRQVLNTPESRPAFMAFLVVRLNETGQQITDSLPQLIEEWCATSPVIAFENASVSHVEGVSILRMSHRAGTENAKVWYRDLCKECDEAFSFIETAARARFPQISDMVEKINTMAKFGEAISKKLND
jgi:hypothetical protein